MAEVTLRPGAVFTLMGNPDLDDLPPVGAPPQWADDDDATYAVVTSDSSSTGQIQARAYLESFEFPGLPTSLVHHVRASTTAANPAPFSLLVVSDDFSVADASWAGAQATATPGWFISDPIAVPNPAAFATCSTGGTIMLGGFQLGDPGVSVDTRTTIHEAYVVVTYGDEPPVVEPVTRMFPRDDALGLGSAPRLFPTPRGIRIVGGQD